MPIANAPTIDKSVDLAAARRDALLVKGDWLNSSQVAASRSDAANGSNPSEYASSLRHKGRLLGIKVRGVYLYPPFQFGSEGNVLPQMAELLEILPRDEYGWASTFWCYQPNSHLGGAAPAEIFCRDPNLVISVAEKGFRRRDEEF